VDARECLAQVGRQVVRRGSRGIIGADAMSHTRKSCGKWRPALPR
jgi:hypothetical protein